jgi:hypothetical protein
MDPQKHLTAHELLSDLRVSHLLQLVTPVSEK